MRNLLLTALLGSLAAAAPASFHLIHITEVFSNADGTVQFVEMEAHDDFQTQLQLAEWVAQNADGTSTTTIYDFTAVFPALDNEETVLLATSAAQTLFGFTADFTIPNNTIPIGTGRVIFRQDGQAGFVDAVAYGSFTGSNAGYGTAAPALPTDGVHSLSRTGDLGTNNTDFTVEDMSPVRNDGTTIASAVEDWMMY